MDWKSVVSQLMALERVPQDKAKSKVSSLSTRQNALDAIKTSLTSLQTAAKGLSFGSGATQPRSVKLLGTSSAATAVTENAAVTGRFDLSVTSLATASNLYGSKNAIASASSILNLKLSDFGVTGGTFTLNGTQYTISDTSQTVGAFFGINAAGGSGGSVNGSAVPGLTVAQDLTTGALTLTSPPLTNPSVGAPRDTSNILSALGFSFSTVNGGSQAVYAQSIPSKALGKLSLLSLQPTAPASQTLTINGASITVESSATVGSIVSAINQSTSMGVTAALDPIRQRIVLTNAGTGEMGVSVGGDAALASALGLKDSFGLDWNSSDPGNGDGWFSRGASASYSLKFNGQSVLNSTGGTSFNSASNSIDLSKHGFGGTVFTLAPDSVPSGGSPLAISAVVSGNSSEARKKIETFISSYNSLRQLVSDKTKVTVGSDGKVSTSVLSDNKEIVGLASSIRSNIFASVVDASNLSLNASYNSISKIGLGFDKEGILSIVDSSALDAALTNQPTAVDALLNAVGTGTSATATQGIGARVSYLVDKMTASSGLFPILTAGISSQTQRLQRQIDDLSKSLAAKQKSLENSFIAMEKAQSMFQSQASALSQAFNFSSK